MKISTLIFFFSLLVFSAPVFGSALPPIYSTNGYGKADIDITGNILTITLTDLAVDPNSVIENISGFSIQFNSSVSGTTFLSDNSILREVMGDGTFTDSAAGALPQHWATTYTSNAITIDDLGSGPGPAYTILGAPGSSGNYQNKQGAGSISGNSPHNPFLDQTATWIFTVPGLSSLSITDVTFQFGTTDGQNHLTTAVTPAPEPASLLLGAGALLLAIGRKRLARKS
jgi:hypothetical protein